MKIIAYHGTDKVFDKFDKSYIYTDYAELGYGFYFTPDERTAADYGERVIKVRLTINKPFKLTKNSYNWLARGLREETIRQKPEIEDLIDLISLDRLGATDLIEKYYDGMIIEDQIVVFNPEQIEILKVLDESSEEFEEVQVLNQKELINLLYKRNMEYRITYDAFKDWYLIATAYNHTHEELLYDAAYMYGLNFDEMVDYYNEHYADLNDLIYTPKTTDIKLGFDHNDIAYIFDKFGTIYTKGQELPKVLLNDLTDRFGEADVKRVEKDLDENLNTLMDKEIIVADSMDSLAYFLKHNRGDYRILIDEVAKLNIIAPIKRTHYDSFFSAVSEGWYPDVNLNTVEDYWNKQIEGGNIWLLIFSSDNEDGVSEWDNIYFTNKYDFGYIYTKDENNYIPSELKSLIGEPLEVTEEETSNSKTKKEDWTKEAVLKHIPKKKKELRQVVEKMSIEDIHREFIKEMFGAYYFVLPRDKEQYIINVYSRKNEEFVNSTGMSYYDDIINKPDYFQKKGRYITKIMMSPVAYIETCVEGFRNNGSSTDYNSLYNSRSDDRKDIEEYKDIIQNGKMDTPVLHYDLSEDGYYFDQEGIHRAIAAKELGMKFIPVYLCVTSTSLDSDSIMNFLAKMITKLNRKRSVIREDISAWLAKTPSKGEKTIKLQELEKELKRLSELKAELGKEISIISNKYRKQNKRWVKSDEWSLKDQKTQENNHKRQLEIDKQIKEIKADIKAVKDYFPPVQTSLFEELNDNFWKWFGNSKTVDKNGNPLVFYHGTRQTFDKFKAKYEDGLLFFAYDEKFAKDWAKGSPLTIEQQELQNGLYDKSKPFNNAVVKKMKQKYNTDDLSSDELYKELKTRTNRYYNRLEKQAGIEPKVMRVYIKAENIFVPERDYELVLDEIISYYEWKNPYTKEYEDKLKEFENAYDVAQAHWDEWWANNKDADEETIQDEEKKLDMAFRKYSRYKSIKNEFDNHIKRIKTGAWVYFEHKNVIDKIWELGYDAIQLSEKQGIITTLAVREGTNQVKSVDNKGTWDNSENIYEHLNRLFEELL